MLDDPTDTVDITDLTVQLCERLGVVASYCYRVDIDVTAHRAKVYLYRGDEGRCKGRKFLVDDADQPVAGKNRTEITGDVKPATEVVTVKILG